MPVSWVMEEHVSLQTRKKLFHWRQDLPPKVWLLELCIGDLGSIREKHKEALVKCEQGESAPDLAFKKNVQSQEEFLAASI